MRQNETTRIIGKWMYPGTSGMYSGNTYVLYVPGLYHTMHGVEASDGLLVGEFQNLKSTASTLLLQP
jgi:hypothetical protein